MRDTIALIEALDHPNVLAFLRVIRAGEGTAGEDGYRVMFGGAHIAGIDNIPGTIDDFSDHPRKVVTRSMRGKSYTSTAAGAYQFLARTWDGLVRQYGFADFEPRTQDIAAVTLIDGRRALDDVLAGRFEAAVRKCNREWASLPESPYGQPTRTMVQARATYQKFGGALSQAPIVAAPVKAAAPILSQEPTMFPLLLPLAGALIDIFTPLAKEKITKEMGRHTDNPQVAEQIASGVLDAAKAVTGLADPIAAVAAVQADPALVQQVEDNTLDNLSKMAPILDKIAEWDKQAWAAEEGSRDQAAARAKGEEYDMTKLLLYGLGGFVFVLLGILAAVIGVQIYKDGVVATEVWAQFAGIIGSVLGIAGTIYAYRFGTSRSSGAKDVVINELSRRK